MFDLPRVSPVGVLESAGPAAVSPRRYPPLLRVLALVMLTLFAGVTVVTGAVSLGAYCSTTDGGDGRELPW